MDLPDVNILVYAHRSELTWHSPCHAWLERVINGAESFGMSELVLSAFVRLVTNPKIFKTPTPLETALQFVDTIRQNENCVIISPDLQHWNIFTRLCREINARGNDIPDTYFAALAIESDCEWITTDRGFARFSNLKWRNPTKNFTPNQVRQD